MLRRQINIITVLPAPLPPSPTLPLMVIIILIRGSAANGYWLSLLSGFKRNLELAFITQASEGRGDRCRAGCWDLFSQAGKAPRVLVSQDTQFKNILLLSGVRRGNWDLLGFFSLQGGVEWQVLLAGVGDSWCATNP